MTPSRLLTTAIIPALCDLEAHGIVSTDGAQRFLLAIALQESGLAHRRQVVSGGVENGPAASFWQFEQGGGCKGVIMHVKTAEIMRKACADYNVTPTPAGLWEAMRYHDIIAAIAARLLIRTLPSAMPVTAQQGWDQYVSAWRPGKPHPGVWASNWAAASATVGVGS